MHVKHGWSHATPWFRTGDNESSQRNERATYIMLTDDISEARDRLRGASPMVTELP